MERPFTPKSLAERWSCSSGKIIYMCQRGDLRHFRIGTQYRIPHQVVAEIEACPEIVQPEEEKPQAALPNPKTERPFVPEIVISRRRR